MSEAREMLESMNPLGGANGAEGYFNKVDRKWKKYTGHIKNPRTRISTAAVLESQMRHMKALTEDTLSTSVGPFRKHIFPVLWSMFPNLIANQLVSVQPMYAPVGAVMFYDYLHGDDKGSTTASSTLIENFNSTYCSEKVDYEIKVLAADVDGIKSAWNDGANAVERRPFKFCPVHPLDTSKQYQNDIYWTSGGVLHTATDDGSGSFYEGASLRGTISYTTGAFTLALAGVVPDAATPIYSVYYFDSEKIAQTRDATVGVSDTSLYDGSEQVSKVPDLKLDITIVEIKARSRKLKARWSVEAVDDLRALYGMDADTELVAGFSHELTLELDREIINDLIVGAQFSASWQFSPVFGGASVHTELESIRHLVTVIDALSARIHIASRRAPANFIVAPPMIVSLMAQLASSGEYMIVNRLFDVQKAADYGPMVANYGIQIMGILGNRYLVYVDPFMTANKILVGLRGARNLDAGYIYSPYIGLQVTDTFLDPQTFMLHKGMRTRYAKYLARPEFYGLVTVSGLPTISG